jgi:formiminoglutamase
VESAIKSIANIQHNRFCKESQLIVLGQLDVSDLMKIWGVVNFVMIVLN